MAPDLVCPIPANESQRIAALRAYEILDTAPELEFDALARLASFTFQTPIAVVSMLDSERLWFKSKIGLDIPQLDRQVAFCAHAIMHPREALVVPDLMADPRFQNNPLVAHSPHLRFYAGAPIVDQAGFPLGTLAVIDTRPREFSAAQLEALYDATTLVMTALKARRRAIDLERLALTDHLTGIGNRARLDKALVEELNFARRTDSRISVLLMDLNGFKAVNDAYGHAAGDEVLCEVAHRVSLLVRQEDVFARLGGDEFAIVMRYTDNHSAEILGKRIQSVIGAPFTLSVGASISIGVSIGYANTENLEINPDSLLCAADRALYAAKPSSKHMR